MKTGLKAVSTQATKDPAKLRADARAEAFAHATASIKLLPPRGRVVDGYRVFPADVGKTRLSEEQIKKAMAAA